MNRLLTIDLIDVGYVINEMADRAVQLFETMSIEANDIILMGLFNACAQLGERHGLVVGKKTFAKMNRRYRDNVNVLTSALDMFIKCNDIASAEAVFHEIPLKTVIKYGAMMKGFNKSNQPMKNFNLFERMKRESITPNEVIFLLLLDSCSQLGLLSRSRMIVQQIPSSSLILAKVQTALINMWV